MAARKVQKAEHLYLCAGRGGRNRLYGVIPEGFDTIHLPEAEYLQFQGQPFCEEDYCEAIHTVQVFMDSYDPAYLGYRWDDENLRIQLEPRGGRGYIELRAVRRVQKWAKRFLLKG